MTMVTVVDSIKKNIAFMKLKRKRMTGICLTEKKEKSLKDVKGQFLKRKK